MKNFIVSWTFCLFWLDTQSSFKLFYQGIIFFRFNMQILAFCRMIVKVLSFGISAVWFWSDWFLWCCWECHCSLPELPKNSIPVSILSNQNVAEKQLCMISRGKVNDIIWESCGGNKWGGQNLVLGKKCVFKFVFIQLERII